MSRCCAPRCIASACRTPWAFRRISPCFVGARGCVRAAAARRADRDGPARRARLVGRIARRRRPRRRSRTCRRRRGAAIRWRNGTQPPSARPLRGGARHAGARAGEKDASPPRSGCSANERPDGRTLKDYFVASAAAHGVAAPGRTGASALGDRTAVSGTQERAGSRSFRGPHVSRLAASRRPDGGGACVYPTRADAPWRRRI